MSAIHRTHCKECNDELTLMNSVYQRQYRASRCKICLYKYNKEHRIQNPKVYTETRLKYDLDKRYNITIEEYNRLNEEQQELCAICKNKCTRNDRLSVDHDHDSNEVRGLLCHNCNILIGLAKSDSMILLNAVSYLHKFYSSKIFS